MYQKRRQATAFTGYGAQSAGGRWNSKGIAIVYTASTLSLALLEIIVNTTEDEPPPDYEYATVDIPDGIAIEHCDTATLPKRWFAHPSAPELRIIGDRWFASRRSVALAVPSAVARIENNVLLNPGHADFKRLAVGIPEDLAVDARLMERMSRRRRRCARDLADVVRRADRAVVLNACGAGL